MSLFGFSWRCEMDKLFRLEDDSDDWEDDEEEENDDEDW